jgi:hypothetical protein
LRQKCKSSSEMKKKSKLHQITLTASSNTLDFANNFSELIRTTGYSGFDPMDFIEWFDETEDEKDESILDILHDFAGHVSSVINSSLDAANTVVNGVLFTFTSFQLGWF